MTRKPYDEILVNPQSNKEKGRNGELLQNGTYKDLSTEERRLYNIAFPAAQEGWPHGIVAAKKWEGIDRTAGAREAIYQFTEITPLKHSNNIGVQMAIRDTDPERTISTKGLKSALEKLSTENKK